MRPEHRSEYTQGKPAFRASLVSCGRLCNGFVQAVEKSSDGFEVGAGSEALQQFPGSYQVGTGCPKVIIAELCLCTPVEGAGEFHVVAVLGQ